MQVSSEEAKMVEISKLQKAFESINLELDAAKSATVSECNKNALLVNQLELSTKEKSSLENRLIAMAELSKENEFLKNSLDSLAKKNSTMELDLVKAGKDNKVAMEKVQEVEEQYSQLQRNLQRCCFIIWKLFVD
ncbi:hypothetical protein HHK36_021867 [Tetracentron sinense]|uniref:Uncharacterized protein n=1 Tax=Tetracentron sinense TaxID=13715 RepID=A0A834YXR8_TETSI|nr:hypothetical protein HHK36_021867 [Tetracentron sinense]